MPNTAIVRPTHFSDMPTTWRDEVICTCGLLNSVSLAIWCGFPTAGLFPNCNRLNSPSQTAVPISNVRLTPGTQKQWVSLTLAGARGNRGEA